MPHKLCKISAWSVQPFGGHSRKKLMGGASTPTPLCRRGLKDVAGAQSQMCLKSGPLDLILSAAQTKPEADVFKKRPERVHEWVDIPGCSPFAKKWRLASRLSPPGWVLRTLFSLGHDLTAFYSNKPTSYSFNPDSFGFHIGWMDEMSTRYYVDEIGMGKLPFVHAIKKCENSQKSIV